jgi:hypothetical protein
MAKERVMPQTIYRVVVASPGERQTSPVLMCSRCELPTRHEHVEDRERGWKSPFIAVKDSGHDAATHNITISAGNASVSGARGVFVEIYGCLACGERREFGVSDAVTVAAPGEVA